MFQSAASIKPEDRKEVSTPIKKGMPESKVQEVGNYAWMEPSYYAGRKCPAILGSLPTTAIV